MKAPPLHLWSSIIILIAGVVHAQTFSASFLPSFILGPLQLFCLACLFFYLEKQSSLRGKLYQALLFGIAHFCSGLYWLFISMNTYGNLPAILAMIAVFLLSLYLSLYSLFSISLFHFFAPRSLFKKALLLATFWAIGEWLRGTIMTGFPWLMLAYAHVDSPLSAWATLGGAYWLTFIVALTASFLSLGLLYRAYRLWGCVLVLFCAGILLNMISWSSPYGDKLSVRLVQGNIDQFEKFHPSTMARRMMENFELATLPITNINNPPKVILFPETIIPSFQHQVSPELWESIIALARQQNTRFIIGTPYMEWPASLSNSLILIDENTTLQDIYEGTKLSRYNKYHLVPFGEYIPVGFRWFVHAIGIPLGDFKRGDTRQHNMQIEDQLLAPNICYEDLFGEELLPALFPLHNQAGATILFNSSNLAWFGDSSALGQHLQIAKLRAIETARPMLRATNTGATAFIDPKGHLKAQLPFLTAGVLDVDVQGMTGYTPYAYMKNYFFLGMMLLIFLISAKRKK